MTRVDHRQHRDHSPSHSVRPLGAAAAVRRPAAHTTSRRCWCGSSTSNGVVGWGEAYGGGGPPRSSRRSTTWITPLAVGQYATDGELTPRLERMLHNLGRAGSVMHALSGLDIALWDIRGKLEGVPVVDAARRRAAASASRSTRRCCNMPARSSDVRRNTARALERGYRHIKLHERTAEAVAAAREVTGPGYPDHGRHQLRLDCPTQATAAVLAMAPSKPFWVEEPIWPPEDFAAMAKLGAATGVPLAMGENATGALDFRKMVAGRRDRLRPAERSSRSAASPLCGALRRDPRPTAITCVPHAFFFGPGYLATLHALAAKEREVHARAVLRRSRLHALCARPCRIVNGAVEVPDAAGSRERTPNELMRRSVAMNGLRPTEISQ